MQEIEAMKRDIQEEREKLDRQRMENLGAAERSILH
jgi:hypothetical protein